MKNKARTKSINKKQVKAVKKEIPPSQKALLSKKKKNEETDNNKPGLKDFAALRKRSTKPRNSRNAEKYWNILENIQDGCFEVDLPGKFTFLNDSVCRILGYSREELTKMNVRQLSDKETLKKVFQAANEVYKTGKPIKEFGWQITRKDGAERCIRGSISLRKDSSGNPIGFLVIANDITDRKQTEFEREAALEALRESEEFLRKTQSIALMGGWKANPETNFLQWTEGVYRIIEAPLDYQPDLREGMKYYTPKTIQILREKMLNILTTNEPFVEECEIVTETGKKLWAEVRGLSHVMEGQTPCVIGTIQDITDRKMAAEALRKSEENFRLSLDSSPLGVRISTIEAETIYANRAILDIYGYDSIEELNKTPVKERYTPQSYAEYKIRKEKRKRGEFVPSEYEISIVRKNSEIRNIQVYRSEVIWNGTKQSQVIYKDITEQKRAEEKLKETLENLRTSIKTTIQVLGTAAEARDPYTAGHQKRVADLARVIATEMGLAHEKIEGIRIAGSIHDIGKLSIPSEILSKPTKLTEIEFALIKEHSRRGYEMLKDVESPWPLAEIVYQHHERMNGSGYPRNLKGDEILMEARIMAVADVVEATASHRPYRPGFGIEAALEEIERNKGMLYDDAVVVTCLKLFREKGYQLP
jgi:PAS domain S-box-containing protein